MYLDFVFVDVCNRIFFEVWLRKLEVKKCRSGVVIQLLVFHPWEVFYQKAASDSALSLCGVCRRE